MHDNTAPRWYPVLRSRESVARHVAFTQLLDDEIALWRDDAGVVRAWENRCPHRGLRLTLGRNAGSELMCRYHGWRFGAGTGACTFIPAHPKQTPPAAAVVRSYRATERYGFIWVSSGDAGSEPDLPEIDERTCLTLRSAWIEAPLDDVARAIARDPKLATTTIGPVRLMLQPETQMTTGLHGIAGVDLHGPERTAFLREWNERFKQLRRDLESAGMR